MLMGMEDCTCWVCPFSSICLLMWLEPTNSMHIGYLHAITTSAFSRVPEWAYRVCVSTTCSCIHSIHRFRWLRRGRANRHSFALLFPSPSMHSYPPVCLCEQGSYHKCALHRHLWMQLICRNPLDLSQSSLKEIIDKCPIVH